MNYFPFHVGDYSAHTAHLEPMEDLAYRRALDAYYLKECPLPRDAAEVARLIRMRAHVAEVEQVLQEFFTLTDLGWVNKRADEEIAKMRDKQTKARSSGLASAAARLSNERSTTVQRTFNDRSTDVQLPTPTPEPIPEETTKTEVVAAAKAPATRSRGCRLPDSWSLPRTWGQWAIQTMGWPDDLVRLEAAKFADYWRAKAGQNASKLDWEATWRNWCRAATPAGQAARPVQSVTVETTAHVDATKRLLADLADNAAKAVPPPASLADLKQSILSKRISDSQNQLAPKH